MAGGVAYASQPHHVWAVGGLRAELQEQGTVPEVTFDARTLDLVTELPPRLADAIAQHELPHICDARPHEDPFVEVWLQRWLDGSIPGADAGPTRLTLGARGLASLQALAEERPEVCPLLRSQLGRLSSGVAGWLRAWPAQEPRRPGLPRSELQLSGPQGAPGAALRPSASGSAWGSQLRAAQGPEPPTAGQLELELHAALDIFRGCGGASEHPQAAAMPRSPPGGAEAASHFCQTALGWIFKLASFYDLDLPGQPARMAQMMEVSNTETYLFGPLWGRLSLLSWRDEEQVAELLRCPFFRPPERSLEEFSRLWAAEQACILANMTAVDSAMTAVGTTATSYGNLGEALPAPVVAAALAQELLDLEAAEEQQPEGEAREADAGTAHFGRGATVGSTGFAGAAALREQAGSDADAAGAQAEAAVSVGAMGEVGAAPKASIRVPGGSFQRMARRADCTTAAYDDPGGLCVAERTADGGTLRCWNVAKELQIVGAARQIVCSALPMQRFGRYRLDFRVVSGVEAESAHFLEVGMCADPAAGVWLRAGEAGIGRPPVPLEEPGAGPFFRFAAVPELLLEGVRLSVEVDFDEEAAHIRNVPAVPGIPGMSPTPLVDWLRQRDHLKVVSERPFGERQCELFRHHAEHLHDMIDRGQLSSDLVAPVLADLGASASMPGREVRPERAEDLHFYIVVPAGLEVEIF